MKYKSSDGNIYSSDNLDPAFIEYLYSLPAEFIEELFITWVIMKNKTQKIPVIDIDAIHRVADKTDNEISDKEIKDFYFYLKRNKVDISKVNNKGESNE